MVHSGEACVQVCESNLRVHHSKLVKASVAKRRDQMELFYLPCCCGHRVDYRTDFLACALQSLPERVGGHVQLASNADNGTRAAMPGFEQCLLFEFERVM